MTGLRKSELASLSPKSFDLDADRPTVTVEARHSKHRRRDVLPLHLELVAELRKWLAGLAPSDKLFPDLAGKNTADMVKYDLEKIGIPYQNDAGFADFHAAGRHTHITELVRSGASLPEVKELARHSDIKMTMKYTHIGMEDQARAISNLPMPKANPKSRSATALQMRCIPAVSESPRVASNDNDPSDRNSPNPCNHKGLGTRSRRLSSNDKVPEVGVEPNLESATTADGDCGCANCPGCCAANALQGGRSVCPALASLDTDLQRVVGAWDGLPTHIRKTILALVGFAEPPANANVPANEAGASTPARRSSR
jgi:hypothetical protein